MTAMSGNAKLAATAILFAIATGLVALAAALHTIAPVFVAWLPLVTVAWVLTREAAESTPAPREETQFESGSQALAVDEPSGAVAEEGSPGHSEEPSPSGAQGTDPEPSQ
jgi:hypothetical protein